MDGSSMLSRTVKERLLFIYLVSILRSSFASVYRERKCTVEAENLGTKARGINTSATYSTNINIPHDATPSNIKISGTNLIQNAHEEYSKDTGRSKAHRGHSSLGTWPTGAPRLLQAISILISRLHRSYIKPIRRAMVIPRAKHKCLRSGRFKAGEIRPRRKRNAGLLEEAKVEGSDVGGRVRLVGAGATFPADVYESWMPVFQYHRSTFSTVDLEYEEIGSSLGKTAKLEDMEGLSYAGSDSVLRVEDLQRHPNLQMVPILAGAVVLGYNLHGIDDVVLNLEATVGIYNGSIRMWTDPLILSLNPNSTLPAREIRVAVRADDSGTTEIFTSALTSFSSAWAENYGTFSEGVDNDVVRTKWAEGVPKLFGRTNRGVSGIVYSYPYSIGYMSITETTLSGVKYAKIINKNNVVGEINAGMIKAVMEERSYNFTSHLTCNLVGSSLDNAYPILGYSYLIVNKKNMSDCAEATELYRYIEWALSDPYAGELCQDRNFAQLPANIAQMVVEEVLKKFQCENGRSVYDLVAIQKLDEFWSEQTWVIPVIVLTSVTFALILALIGYCLYQRLKFRRAVLSDCWYISPNDILINYDQIKGAATYRGSAFTGQQSLLSETSKKLPSTVRKLGSWSGRKIVLREIGSMNSAITNTSTKVMILQWKTKMHHPNVLRTFGVTSFDDCLYFVSEDAQKGALADVLKNTKYNLCDNFKFSMAIDVASGVDFLHRQGIIHGNLTSTSCFLDGRWNVKVADWEYLQLPREQWNSGTLNFPNPTHQAEESYEMVTTAQNMYWTAPELLVEGKISTPTKYSDVYSFAVILVEIFSRLPPYEELRGKLGPPQIIEAVVKADIRPYCRDLSPQNVQTILSMSWKRDPTQRPNFSQITKMLNTFRPSKRSVVESMMDTLEEYVTALEEKVQERTRELAEVNKNLEHLLHQILPPYVAAKLAQGESVSPESFDSVTIFFSDVVGFTKLCSDSDPMEVITFLNALYVTFDGIIDQYDVYKVETIGDAYMVISGLPTRNGIEHAGNIARMSLHFLRSVRTFRIQHKPGTSLQLRVGIHSGPVVAGVVGSKMPRYCLFGDTVNTASRMESSSLPMEIQVSKWTHALLEEIGGFQFELRGALIKDKGTVPTYFLRDD